MQRSHVLLGACALALVGAAVWLFHEVNATPAEAGVASQVAHGDDTANAKPDTAPRRSDWTAAATGIKQAIAKPTDTPAPTDDMASHTKIVPPVGDPRPIGHANFGGSDDQKANPHWDAVLDEVNKSYDRGDFDEAKTQAINVLKKDPENVRMLRVAVSSSCILGDNADAQTYYAKLRSPRDRDQMKMRCDRYGVTFTDPK